VPPSGTIINLIQLETLPPLPEQKIRDAIQAIGGQNVTARRILHGNVRDDSMDTLVLEGNVPNQVALVRVLTVAAQLFVGQTITENDIRVVADEAGGLAEESQVQGAQSFLSGGATATLFGGSRSIRLTNQVQRNLGRAKAVQAAGGRILSFIEVRDLPQIRVDIRLVEINRSKLRSLNLDSALLLSNAEESSLVRLPSPNPSRSGVAIQGGTRTSSTFVQDLLSFFSGGLLNQFQFSGEHAAIDFTLALLERQGVARSLSSPSITVLSGELAQVQVGGEVPVPVAFSPAFGGAGAAAATPGVFNSVEFVPFGVQLQVRPLVGDDDSITLDVQPIIITPDTILTDTIRQSTGAALPTTAFQTRALRTSSRLQDGQALLIGGLVTTNSSTNTASTPGLREVPIFGRLFQGFDANDQSTELVMVVNPVLLRTPLFEAALWAFPGRDELMRSITAGAAGPVTR
jgi:Flp pilus assembly secretin CpaC